MPKFYSKSQNAKNQVRFIDGEFNTKVIFVLLYKVFVRIGLIQNIANKDILPKMENRDGEKNRISVKLPL